MAKELNLFDFLNSIWNKNKLKYDKKKASAYMLTLWISHERNLIQYANEINKYLFTLTDDAVYNYFFYKVPRGKRFVKWIKKEEVNKKKQKEIDELAEKYNISKREAKLSLNY